MNRTKLPHDFILLLILFLTLVAAHKSSAQFGTGYVHNAPTSVLFIYGDATHPVAISSGLIRVMHQVQLKVMANGSNHVEIYSGVPLKDLLAKADVSESKDLHSKAVSFSLAAVDKDGNKIVLSHAETDSAFNDSSQVIVADALNGKQLKTSSGPLMLVILGDKVPTHLIHNLARIQVNTAN